MTSMHNETPRRATPTPTTKISATVWALAVLLGLTACATQQPEFGQPAATRPDSKVETRRAEESLSPRELAARLARQMVGTPYRYGGSSPETGFDCSGLVFYSYAQSGASVPRTALDQFRTSRKISLADARPGDIVFFQDQEKLSHVGIYLGRGQFVHAPSSGKRVTLAHIDTPYYREQLVAVGRLSLN